MGVYNMLLVEQSWWSNKKVLSGEVINVVDTDTLLLSKADTNFLLTTGFSLANIMNLGRDEKSLIIYPILEYTFKSKDVFCYWSAINGAKMSIGNDNYIKLELVNNYVKVNDTEEIMSVDYIGFPHRYKMDEKIHINLYFQGKLQQRLDLEEYAINKTGVGSQLKRRCILE